MRARGLRAPRAGEHIGTAFGVALAGAAIALSAPAYAAPEGPDSVEETVVEQASQTSVVDISHLGAVPLGKGRVLGAEPGLAPLRLPQALFSLDAG